MHTVSATLDEVVVGSCGSCHDMTMTTAKTGGSKKQLLDYSEAEQMLRAGKTQAQVAEKFGVSQSAVSLAIKRGRIKFDTGFERLLPWNMKAEHINLSVPRGLRLAMRVQRDDAEARAMPPYLRAQGEGFIRTLEEMDAVIHYDPEVHPHWFRVPRRHGIDQGLIREPNID